MVQKTAILLLYRMKGRKKSNGSASLLDKQQKTIKKIGARIKALRIEKGHSSYEKFAFENEIDRAQYGKYERGSDMRISSLVRILTILDIDLAEFFSEGFD